nr:MAG TPA: hypothetical protein [Caudoviricetes sp.]
MNITITAERQSQQLPLQQPLLDKRISRIAQMLIFRGIHFELHGVREQKNTKPTEDIWEDI